MPISAGDFRKGVVFEMDGKPMLVVDFQTSSPARAPLSCVPSTRT